MVTAYLTNRISQFLLAGVALAMPAIPLSAQSFRDSVELEPVVVTFTQKYGNMPFAFEGQFTGTRK